MQTIRRATLGVFCLSLAGACSDDDTGISLAQIQRYCDSLCQKTEDCGLLLGLTASQCAATCKAAASKNSDDPDESDCNPTRSEVDSCVSDLTSASCSALTGGNLPASCSSICPDDDDDAGSVPNDAGVDGDATSGVNPDGGVSDLLSSDLLPSSDLFGGIDFRLSGGDAFRGACSRLAACCSSISNTTLKVACQQVVEVGSDIACDGAESTTFGSECS